MSLTTNSAIDEVKSGLKGIHVIGESIRCSINGAVDHTVHDATGKAKSKVIANKGEAEMRQVRPSWTKTRVLEQPQQV
jgi:hypothetical protein